MQRRVWIAGFIFLLVVAGGLPNPATSTTADDEIATAVDRLIPYIRGFQRVDGGFCANEQDSTCTAETPWTTIALSAAGLDPRLVKRDGVAARNSAQWMASNSGLYAAEAESGQAGPNAYARLILGIAAAYADPNNHGGDQIQALRNQYQDDGNGHGHFGSTQHLVSWNAFSILALRAGNVPATDAMIQGALRSIEAAQHPTDGCWQMQPTWGPASVCDTDVSAAVVAALVAAGRSTSDTRVVAGVDFIKSMQRSTGAFMGRPGQEDNPWSTVWAIWGLRSAGVDPRALPKDPVLYLARNVLDDGSVRFASQTALSDTRLWAAREFLLGLTAARLPLAAYLPATASVTTDNPMAGEPTLFAVAGTATRHEWSYTFDGQTRSFTGLRHVFAEPGTYRLTLRATDSGYGMQMAYLDVHIAANPNPTSTAARAPVLGPMTVHPHSPHIDAPTTLRMTATDSNGDDGAIRFAWDFGDRATAATTEPVATHIYTVAGTYDVLVTATDAEGLEAQSTLTVVVGETNAAPTVQIVGADTAARSGPVTLTANAVDPDGDDLVLTWRREGTIVGTSRELELEPAAPGAQRIVLEARDPLGAVAESRFTLNWKDSLPQAIIVGPTHVAAGTHNYRAAAFDADGDSMTYSWLLNGLAQDGDEDTTVLVEVGSHELTLYVDTLYGAVQEHQTIVVVHASSSDLNVHESPLSVFLPVVALLLLAALVRRRR